MRKKVIGGIVISAVVLACCAVIILTKETKNDDKIVEREVKKVEKSLPEPSQKTIAIKEKNVKKEVGLKTDLYKGVPDWNTILPMAPVLPVFHDT